MGVVGTSNLEQRPVKGVGTVVAGHDRGAGPHNGITSLQRELGQVVWRGLATWRASTHVQARGRGTDSWRREWWAWCSALLCFS